jgi:hypothetical protein
LPKNGKLVLLKQAVKIVERWGNDAMTIANTMGFGWTIPNDPALLAGRIG